MWGREVIGETYRESWEEGMRESLKYFQALEEPLKDSMVGHDHVHVSHSEPSLGLLCGR